MTSPLRAVALATLGAVALAGCIPSSTPEETQTISAPATAAPTSGPASSPAITPSASPSPSPSPSPSADVDGPITSAPDGTPVTPEILLAAADTEEGVLVVQANVPGIVEDGGQCEVTVTAQSVTLSASNTGAANVTTTECGQFTFPLSKLPGGSASVTVAYASTSHQGTSPATKVSLS